MAAPCDEIWGLSSVTALLARWRQCMKRVEMHLVVAFVTSTKRQVLPATSFGEFELKCLDILFRHRHDTNDSPLTQAEIDDIQTHKRGSASTVGDLWRFVFLPFQNECRDETSSDFVFVELFPDNST